MSEQQQQQPDKLDPDQMEWMSNQGLIIYATLVPNKTRIAANGKNPGVDPSTVQLSIMLQSKGQTRFLQTDFVPNNHADLTALMDIHIKEGVKSLLEKHFDLEPPSVDTIPFPGKTGE